MAAEIVDPRAVSGSGNGISDSAPVALFDIEKLAAKQYFIYVRTHMYNYEVLSPAA